MTWHITIMMMMWHDIIMMSSYWNPIEKIVSWGQDANILYSTCNDSLKLFIFSLLRDCPLNEPVPIHFSPEHLINYVMAHASSIGLYNLKASTTPTFNASSLHVSHVVLFLIAGWAFSADFCLVCPSLELRLPHLHRDVSEVVCW